MPMEPMVGQLMPIACNFSRPIAIFPSTLQSSFSASFHMDSYPPMRRRNRFGFALLTFTFLILAIVTPFWQIEQTSIDYVLHAQYIPVLSVVNGFSSAPYQYRPLASYQAAIAAIIAHQNGLPYGMGFIVLRALQNL